MPSSLALSGRRWRCEPGEDSEGNSPGNDALHRLNALGGAMLCPQSHPYLEPIRTLPVSLPHTADHAQPAGDRPKESSTTRPRRGSCAQRRQATREAELPGRTDPQVEEVRTTPKCLSRSRGAAERASPERTVFPTRARRGSCRQRCQAAPGGQSRLAARSRRPRAREAGDGNRTGASRVSGASLAVQRRREQCRAHGPGERCAASGVRRLGKPIAPGRTKPPGARTTTKRLSRSRDVADGASPERTVFPTRARRGSCRQRCQAAPGGQSRLAARSHRPRARDGGGRT